MPKFKIDETVIIVAQTHGWGNAEPGYEAKITFVYPNADVYYADVYNNEGELVHRSWTGKEQCFKAKEKKYKQVEMIF